MGIINTIIRSQDDNAKPHKKSYGDCRLEIELLPVEKITDKKRLLPSEKRAMAYELTPGEHCQQVIVIDNTNKMLGRLTTLQIKEMLDDMGFNVDTIMSGPHFSDFSAVMNIDGFLVPFWEPTALFFSKLFHISSKLVITKLSPGKNRLHIRVFENNDGKWIIASHTDVNWMDPNPFKVYHAHIEKGTGDFVRGTALMYELLKSFNETLKENRLFTLKNINTSLKQAGKELSSRE